MYFPLTPYNAFTPTSNWNMFQSYNNVFTDKEIEDLETFVHSNYEFSKGKTGATEDGTATDSYRTNNRDIAYMSPSPDTKWLYDRLFPLALDANHKSFHFDIDIVTDPIHYVIYPEDGGHLDWHMDVGVYGTNKRKLAMTVQLSDPNEYTGGEFEIWMGGKDGFIELPRQKGEVIIFPTFCMHRVKPITSGRRKCLVFWTGGRPFR